MLKVKSLLDHTISPNEYEKNDKTILKYFQKLRNFFCEYTFKSLGWAKFIALFAKSINNLKSIRYIFLIKYYFIILFVTIVEVKMKKYLRKKNQSKY